MEPHLGSAAWLYSTTAILFPKVFPEGISAVDEVIGATLNKTRALKFRATKVGKDTALAQIVKMLQDAQNSKAPIACLVHTISGYFACGHDPGSLHPAPQKCCSLISTRAPCFRKTNRSRWNLRPTKPASTVFSARWVSGEEN